MAIRGYLVSLYGRIALHLKKWWKPHIHDFIVVLKIMKINTLYDNDDRQRHTLLKKNPPTWAFGAAELELYSREFIRLINQPKNTILSHHSQLTTKVFFSHFIISIVFFNEHLQILNFLSTFHIFTSLSVYRHICKSIEKVLLC